jgi:hypothetical protein
MAKYAIVPKKIIEELVALAGGRSGKTGVKDLIDKSVVSWDSKIGQQVARSSVAKGKNTSTNVLIPKERWENLQTIWERKRPSARNRGVMNTQDSTTAELLDESGGRLLMGSRREDPKRVLRSRQERNLQSNRMEEEMVSGLGGKYSKPDPATEAKRIRSNRDVHLPASSLVKPRRGSIVRKWSKKRGEFTYGFKDEMGQTAGSYRTRDEAIQALTRYQIKLFS